MALSYMKKEQINGGLVGSHDQFDMKQDSENNALSPSFSNNNNNNNNNNNTPMSIFPRLGAAATGFSMFSPEQILAASRTAALMAAGLPISLHASLAAANQSLYGNQPLSMFSGWPSQPTSSPPPHQRPISPERVTNNNNNNNNNNNIVSSTADKMAKKGQIKRRGPKSKMDSVKVEGASTPAPSPPTSVTSLDVVAKDTRDKVFTCGVCLRSFGYKHVLQNHERTHTGEKPFECHVCRKRFTRDHHLKTHMRLHTGEKPYHCSHCDRQFVQVANLRRHLRVHTGERPYACELCTAKFSDSNQLKAHLLIHKGEKPFECEHCPMRFRRRHHLLHHKCSSSARSHVTTPSIASDDMEEDLDVDIKAEIEDRKFTHTPSSKATKPAHQYQLPAPSMDPYMPIPLNLSSLPMQTEPEDLSMSTGVHWTLSRNHSNGDSPLSHSPSSDIPEYFDDDLDVSDKDRKPQFTFPSSTWNLYQQSEREMANINTTSS